MGLGVSPGLRVQFAKSAALKSLVAEFFCSWQSSAFSSFFEKALRESAMKGKAWRGCNIWKKLTSMVSQT